MSLFTVCVCCGNYPPNINRNPTRRGHGSTALAPRAAKSQRATRLAARSAPPAPTPRHLPALSPSLALLLLSPIKELSLPPEPHTAQQEQQAPSWLRSHRDRPERAALRSSFLSVSPSLSPSLSLSLSLSLSFALRPRSLSLRPREPAATAASGDGGPLARPPPSSTALIRQRPWTPPRRRWPRTCRRASARAACS